MIKKTVTAIVAVLLAVAFISCDSGGGDSDSSSGITEKEYDVPSVLSLGDLPASGADAPPASADEAKEIFTGALAAISVNASPNSGIESIVAEARKARATDSDFVPIDRVIEVETGGTVSYRGFANAYYSYPDDDWAPSANSTYNNFEIMRVNTELNTELEDCIMNYTDPVYYSSESMTVNGESQDNMYMSFGIDLHTGSDMEEGTDASFDVNIDFSYGYAASYSIRRNTDGKGGKFIVTYSGSISDEQEDLSYEFDDIDLTPFYTQLYSQMVTIKVYDDNDAFILETTVPLTEFSAEIEDYVEDF